MTVTETSIAVAADRQVSALLQRPDDAVAMLVLGHGAGAGMHHEFMVRIARLLGERGVATLRYQFPYMERGRRSPDSRALLIATTRAAVAAAREAEPVLPLFAGGKSMGGRMTSLGLAAEPDAGIRGLIFFGFPLHNAGRRANDRADHLFDVAQPMLFLQGTRDKLADLDYLKPVCERLNERATLHVVEGADHSFGVLKRDRRSHDEVLVELASSARRWIDGRLS